MKLTTATAEPDFLPPTAWRREAFAEDLDDAPAAPLPRRVPAGTVLLSALAPGLALVGALAMLLRHTA
jgi:hypothetical protein